MLQVVTSFFSTAPSSVYRFTRDQVGWVIALIPIGLLLAFATSFQDVIHGEIPSVNRQWVPSLDVNLSFRLDGLSLFFALLVTGIGALVFIYSNRYIERYIGRFYLYLTLFMLAMLGMVLADNIILVFIFWELTSFSSFLLIGFDHRREAAREAARQALIVTSAGGLVMLAGFLLLTITTGTWKLSEMTVYRATIQNSDLYLPILLLITIGAFTKSAQFPFHFWLPRAMEAPTPVSAYLHSATMVNAGIYLLARLFPVLGQTNEWETILIPIGVITLLIGGYLAWQQTDLKLILAYSTISMLGMMVLLLGVGSEAAIAASLVLLLAHALYKGALFMVAGAVDHETGTRDIQALGGLWRTMPTTAAAAGLAALSMMGIPPLLGFIAKESIYKTALADKGALAPVLLLTVVLGNLFNVTAALTVLCPFWGLPRAPRKLTHDVSASMWIGPLLLAGISLLFGLLSAPLLHSLLDRMAQAVSGGTLDVELGLWHGLNRSLALSLLTITGGALLYWGVDRIRPAAAGLSAIGQNIGPARLYTAAINGVLNAASWGSYILLKAYLRQYIRIILIIFVSVLFYVFATETEFDNLLRHRVAVRFYELTLAVVVIAAALTATQINKRLSAAAALGTVGYGVTLMYVFYGAPDLAMTQFAIETLTVILFVVVIYRLPKLKKLSSTTSRRLDAVLATLVGGTMTLLTLVVTSTPLKSRLSPYFAEKSYLAAHGHNVVNVILVDFRGFDTMGEITVLSVAAIGVYALLRLNLHKDRSEKEDN